ncbi:hypothetical protein KFK09_029055 [Dendrobium nobile]|uniref:Uncharacterized protein n=1 Tax=Dendrobium nobile TaxID=94219 RepID=A0A8T3A9I9_DENNO|nr:hypothetical protein KFK09_029055 [Dendrobium nobile]
MGFGLGVLCEQRDGERERGSCEREGFVRVRGVRVLQKPRVWGFLRAEEETERSFVSPGTPDANGRKSDGISELQRCREGACEEQLLGQVTGPNKSSSHGLRFKPGLTPYLIAWGDGQTRLKSSQLHLHAQISPNSPLALGN